ncbi:MAG: ABC transporter ATP-binding protein [Geminicoccaceae bacterium]|nr:MAG: ABC transporter ATP-binding protein [Geminicoccaceae bacterium]
MSSDPTEVAIAVDNLSKYYEVYQIPVDRLKQIIFKNRKYYQEYWALRDVSFTVHRGETVGIIGSNGAGKSTLLKIITGTLTPSTGTVTRNGRIAALLELGTGFNAEFSGRENVEVAASILGLGRGDIIARMPDIIAFAGLGDFIDQPVKTYSSGMYARLAFSVAAHVDADVLIIDEILSVGDAAFTQKCMRFLHRFKQRGTVLFVSHDTAAVINLCDRVAWIHAGQVKAIGPTKEITEDYLAAMQAANDVEGTFQIGRARRDALARRSHGVRDPRHAVWEAAGRGNTIELFEFDPEANWSGHRGGVITNVALLDSDGHTLQVMQGGTEVVLRIEAQAETEIVNPILGFLIRDRLGQDLFGDNTLLATREAPLVLAPGEVMRAEFRFQMPYLPTHQHSITAALAAGTLNDHVNHHWIDDALFFQVVAGHFSYGLIGLPMLGVAVEKLGVTNR